MLYILKVSNFLAAKIFTMQKVIYFTVEVSGDISVFLFNTIDRVALGRINEDGSFTIKKIMLTI